MVITAKKDGSIKLAMDAKPMNAQIVKNKYQMPNLLEKLKVAAQIINTDTPGEVWFTSLDLKYAFSQLLLSDIVSSHCNFSIVCGKSTGTYRFKTGFYGLTYMPKEFQKTMDKTLQNVKRVISFLDDILIVSKGSFEKQNKIVKNVLLKHDKERFALKLSRCEFSVIRISWLGFDIWENGYQPKLSKVLAVLELKPPHTLKQLRSFMGVLNHLQKFLPNLHVLTQKFRRSLKMSNRQKFV